MFSFLSPLVPPLSLVALKQIFMFVFLQNVYASERRERNSFLLPTEKIFYHKIKLIFLYVNATNEEKKREDAFMLDWNFSDFYFSLPEK